MPTSKNINIVISKKAIVAWASKDIHDYNKTKQLDYTRDNKIGIRVRLYCNSKN